jgi:hypothetical protein
MSDTEEFNKILLQMKQRIYFYIYMYVCVYVYIYFFQNTFDDLYWSQFKYHFFQYVLQIK